MQSMPDLKLVVEEKRGTIDVFRMWLPRIAVVLAFVFIGYTKFDNDPRSEWVKIFEQIGFGQWFRYFTGAMQIAGALLMLTPWTLTLGAAMLACTMVGAMLVDIFVAHAVGFAFAPLVLLGMIVAVWFTGRFGAVSAPTSD
jgi:putative oxidoreductase